jgi:hypothetical protein
MLISFFFQEEELYEIDIPLSFVASVGTRVHGLACWFDVLFNGRSVYLSLYWNSLWTSSISELHLLF